MLKIKDFIATNQSVDLKRMVPSHSDFFDGKAREWCFFNILELKITELCFRLPGNMESIKVFVRDEGKLICYKIKERRKTETW